MRVLVIGFPLYRLSRPAKATTGTTV